LPAQAYGGGPKHIAPPAAFADAGEPTTIKQTQFRIDHGHDHGHNWQMEPVSKSALKAKMLEYFRKVEETGEELVVTDNNQPTLRIVPIRARISAAVSFADVRGRVVYHEDVLAPTADEWSET
jgi:prevent-host-death family protein